MKKRICEKLMGQGTHSSPDWCGGTRKDQLNFLVLFFDIFSSVFWHFFCRKLMYGENIIFSRLILLVTFLLLQFWKICIFFSIPAANSELFEPIFDLLRKRLTLFKLGILADSVISLKLKKKKLSWNWAEF